MVLDLIGILAIFVVVAGGSFFLGYVRGMARMGKAAATLWVKAEENKCAVMNDTVYLFVPVMSPVPENFDPAKLEVMTGTEEEFSLMKQEPKGFA